MVLPDEPLSPESILSNTTTLSNSRAILALLTGTAAGILGLEGISGFLFYAGCSIVFSLMMVVRIGGKGGDYFVNAQELWVGGVFGDMSSFVLFWVLAYGVVYIYE